MKKIIYIVKEREGLHARPAGMLAKECRRFSSRITISCNGKTEELTGIFAVLKMGIKYGEQIEIAVEGEDEEEAVLELEKVLNVNL